MAIYNDHMVQSVDIEQYVTWMNDKLFWNHFLQFSMR